MRAVFLVALETSFWCLHVDTFVGHVTARTGGGVGGGEKRGEIQCSLALWVHAAVGTHAANFWRHRFRPG